MKLTQIRNATLVVEYAGIPFLIDPMLAPKGSYPPLPHSIRQDLKNPLIDLPIPAEQIIDGIEAVFLSHLHQDHFDDAAKEYLPKNIHVFVQNEADQQQVEEAGFNNVEVLTENTHFRGVHLSRTKAQHGKGEILKLTGSVSGIVFRHPSEKTLYIAGDTIWYEGVREELEMHQPDIIVVNGGDNQLLQGGPIIMGKEDIHQVHQAVPDAYIVVSHLEAINHWTLSRAELKRFIAEKGIGSRVLVPDDGESYTFGLTDDLT